MSQEDDGHGLVKTLCEQHNDFIAAGIAVLLGLPRSDDAKQIRPNDPARGTMPEPTAPYEPA